MFHLHQVQAAIIDLDGTLIDTVGDFEAALNAMLADLRLPPVFRPFIQRTVGKGSEHLIRQVLAHVGGEPGLYERAWARYQHHYTEFNGRYASIYPGVVPGLEGLRGRAWRMACVTNKPTEAARNLLRKKGLSDYFSHVYGGDAFERKKPDPLPLLRTCAALGVPPAHTLMIGDSSNDAQAARAAGCPVVLVSYGYNHGEPVQSAGADAVIERIDALS